MSRREPCGAALPLPRAAAWLCPLTYAATDAGITDSKEEVVKYFTNATDGRVDQAVLNSFIDNGSTFIDWISEEMGWKFAASPLFGDYYEPMDGWIPMGRGSLGAADASRFALGCSDVGSDVPTTCSTRRSPTMTRASRAM